MHGLKSAILAIFPKGLGWPCPVQCGPQKCIIAFEKLFLFWVPMNLESVDSFLLKYSKIPVWLVVVSPKTNVEETYFCLSVWANNRLRFKKSFWNEAQETKRRKSRRTRVKMFPSTNFNRSEQQYLYRPWNNCFSFRETFIKGILA